MGTENKIQGYIYVTTEDEELFIGAKVGDRIIKKDRKPPYLVVDHTLDRIVVNRWPGKLYRVEVLDQDSDVERSINENLVENIWYTRTYGVQILEELDPFTLFGENGHSVAVIADFASAISLEQAKKLSTYSLDENRKIISKLWKNWTALTDPEYANQDIDWTDTIAEHPKGQDKVSPVGYALSLIYLRGFRRARELEDDNAIQFDEDENVYLVEKWQNVVSHLINVALSYETDGLLTDKEIKQLRQPVCDVMSMVCKDN